MIRNLSIAVVLILFLVFLILSKKKTDHVTLQESQCRRQAIALQDDFGVGESFEELQRKLAGLDLKYSVWRGDVEVSQRDALQSHAPIDVFIRAGVLPGRDYFVAGREEIVLSFDSSAKLVRKECEVIFTGP